MCLIFTRSYIISSLYCMRTTYSNRYVFLAVTAGRWTVGSDFVCFNRRLLLRGLPNKHTCVSGALLLQFATTAVCVFCLGESLAVTGPRTAITWPQRTLIACRSSETVGSTLSNYAHTYDTLSGQSFTYAVLMIDKAHRVASRRTQTVDYVVWMQHTCGAGTWVQPALLLIPSIVASQA